LKKLLSSFIALVLVATLFNVPTFAASSVNYHLVQDTTNEDRYYFEKGGSRTNLDANFRVDFMNDGYLQVSGYTVVFESYSNGAEMGRVTTLPGQTDMQYIEFYIDFKFVEIESVGQYLNIDELAGVGFGSGVAIYLTDFVYADNVEPVLNGQTAFVTNYDNPITEAQIRTYIHAYDNVDGDISHLIQLASATYDPATASVGQYELNYSVTDSAGNSSTLKVFVLVKDVTAPEMMLEEYMSTVSYTQTFDVEALKSTISNLASDNYDANSNILVTILSNGYTANKAIPGLYDITFEASDSAGNKSQMIYQINVIDDIAPIASYNETIYKPVTSTLTIQDIIADITATDIISGNVTDTLEVLNDGYTGNGNKVGLYDIEFSVHDDAGNYTFFTVTVHATDNIPPVFMVTPGQFIRVEDIVTLSNEDFVDILVRTGQLTLPEGSQYMMLVNEYEGNSSIPGLYAVSMKFMAATGETEVKSFAVEVLETAPIDGVIEDSRDLWAHVVDYVKANPVQSGLILVGSLIVIGSITFVLIQSNNYKPAHQRKSKYSKYRK